MLPHQASEPKHCRERKTYGPPPSLDSPARLKSSLWDARLRRELLTLCEKTARGGRRRLWVCSRDAQTGALPLTPPNWRSSLQTQRAAAPPHRGAFQGCPGEREARKGCTPPTAAPKREPPLWAVRIMVPMVP